MKVHYKIYSLDWGGGSPKASPFLFIVRVRVRPSGVKILSALVGGCVMRKSS